MSFITESNELVLSFLSADDKEERIDMFLLQNRKLLPKNKYSTIKEILMNMDEKKLKNILMSADEEFNDPTIALVLSLFLGSLGIDRFYIGDTGLGVLKLVTFGGFGIWTFIDWFVIMKRTKNNNFKELMELCKTF